MTNRATIVTARKPTRRALADWRTIRAARSGERSLRWADGGAEKREAGTGAQTLIGETANQAKADARTLVGEAMAECERLLRTAGELSAEANEIRTTLAKADVLQDIKARGTLIVGVKADYRPFGFRDPAGNLIRIQELR